MKKLLLLALLLNLCPFLKAPVHSQTPFQKKPELSPQNENGSTPADAAGLEPNPLNRLYPPHQQPLAPTSTLLKNGTAPMLSGDVQEAWVARHDEPGHGRDMATDMVVDGSGNIYVTGYSHSFGTSLDYLTIKYNAAGVQQWTARYNGPGSGTDHAVALAVDGAGNVYVTGYVYTAGYASSNASYDYATIKYNAAGTQEWVAIYDGNGYPSALAVDGAGNVYVTGSVATVKYNSTGTQEWAKTFGGADLGIDAAGNVYIAGYSGTYPNYDYATVKYNPAGTQEWMATYNGPGNNYDAAVGLDIDAVGNVCVTGFSSGSGTGYDYTTIKYNPAGTQQWKATYNNGGDYAHALDVDAAGNVYVTGYSLSAINGADYATVKYNSAGAQQWVATVGNGANRDDYPVALGVDAAGNVYVTGVRGNDYYTVKYNSTGNKKWSAKYDGPENEDDVAVALAVDGAGNVHVAGHSFSSVTSTDYATVKYNTLGVEQWAVRHDEPGHNNDVATAMVVDGSGNVYVTGYSELFGGYSDYLTIKYDAAGIKKWVARYNGPGNRDDHAFAMGIDANGNIYVTGRSFDALTKNDYATIKYNSAGQVLWVARYNGPDNDYDHAVALAFDATGNVYVTGVSSSDYATVKYNSAGLEQWVARYNGPANKYDQPVALVIGSASGDVYVTGNSLGLVTGVPPNSLDDYATVKYNSAGQEQWIAHYGMLYSDDEVSALGIDAAGNVYVTGGSGGDFATIKYNSTGQEQWVARYNPVGQANALGIDAAGNVYVTGGSNGYATIKYNSGGQEQWVAPYNANNGRALAVDNAGNVYVTGNGGADYTTIKYNPAGAQEWVATYNGPGNGNNDVIALAVDNADNVYVTGSSFGSGLDYDFATIKYTQFPPPLADAGADKKICAGSSVPIGGNPTASGGKGGPYTFSWTPTTGLNDPTAPNPIAAAAKTTTYVVTVTETATGLSAVDNITVTVPAPVGWSVAHIVDVDEVILGIDQGATIKAAPRDNCGLTLSYDERFLYLGYNAPNSKRLLRKINLSISDPANNHSAVVAQLKLPPGSQPARDITTDDKGRVYLALGTKIEIYNSNLNTLLHTISGFTACEGVAVRRENGTLVAYATDRLDKTLDRFALVEGAGELIASSSKAGLDGDGEIVIAGSSRPRGLAIAGNGTVWIADPGKNKVYRVSSAGKTVDSTGVKSAMDIAIDESRGEVYVSQYTQRTIKVLNLSTGKIKRTLAPPAADLNIDLDGETGAGALSGIDVGSCQRVFVANGQGRSLLTGNPPDSPFSNFGDNNDVKAADTDPVLVVAGDVLAKEFEAEESEIASDQLAVTSYQLEPSYPNPFSPSPRLGENPSTVISFALPEAGKVTVNIYNEIGQLVHTLIEHEMATGRHSVHWNGRGRLGQPVAAGMYLYRITVRDKEGSTIFTQTRRMTLLK